MAGGRLRMAGGRLWMAGGRLLADGRRSSACGWSEKSSAGGPVVVCRWRLTDPDGQCRKVGAIGVSAGWG